MPLEGEHGPTRPDGPHVKLPAWWGWTEACPAPNIGMLRVRRWHHILNKTNNVRVWSQGAVHCDATLVQQFCSLLRTAIRVGGPSHPLNCLNHVVARQGQRRNSSQQRSLTRELRRVVPSNNRTARHRKRVNVSRCRSRGGACRLMHGASWASYAHERGLEGKRFVYGAMLAGVDQAWVHIAVKC